MKTISESDNEYLCEVQAPCFQSLNADEVELIKNGKTQVMFRKGENLTKQGTFASYVLFIIDGLVKQYIEAEQNKNYNLRLLQSGDFIGLSIVFDKNTFNYSTVALRDTKAFLIEKSAIEKVIKQNGNFTYNIIKRNFEIESGLYESLRNLLYKQMNGRLADALLYLSSDMFAGESTFTLLSRKDIADFAGLSTESTVKLLKAFEKDGIIRLDEKDVIIENHELLKEISRRG